MLHTEYKRTFPPLVIKPIHVKRKKNLIENRTLQGFFALSILMDAFVVLSKMLTCPDSQTLIRLSVMVHRVDISLLSQLTDKNMPTFCFCDKAPQCVTVLHLY